ncbi:MAG: PEP-CTERM sorting domain-containing protein [Pirellulales bacterium]
MKPALLVLCAALLAAPATAQLRVVDWNAAIVTNPAGSTVPRAGTTTVLEAIGIETKNGIQRAPDVITLQEADSALIGTNTIMNQLNALYGAGTYARSTIAGTSIGTSETQTVIYNTNTVSLISQTALGVASAAGPARAPMRFEFRPVGYGADSDFYVYSSHYKAGTDNTPPSDATRRNVEAQIIRNDADALGAGVRAIFAGDYNIQTSSEAMYQTLTGVGGGGPGRAFDPISSPGSWGNNAAFAPIHTQAPLVTGVNNLTGGGMDDRYDFQLVTENMTQGNGLAYIGLGTPNTLIPASQHSYHAFGNNGTTFNNNINAAANTALPLSEYNPSGSQPSRTTVLNSLTTASDHLPVVMDLQLPAKQGATLGAVPAQVIQNTPLSVGLNVSNVAPVAVAIGADELTYNYTGSGAATGGGSDTSLALAAPNVHNLTLDTTTLGPQVGNVNVTGTSQQVADGVFNDSRNYTVLQHSAGEFIGATAPQTLDIDFGTLLLGAGTVQEDFEITNLAAVFRADLDLNSFAESGDTFSRFMTDLSPFSGLAAGSTSGLFNVSFSIDQLGSFSASYLLQIADEAGVFGGTGDTMTLNVFGNVIAVPEPASWVFAGAALAAMGTLCVRRRRRRMAA